MDCVRGVAKSKTLGVLSVVRLRVRRLQFLPNVS